MPVILQELEHFTLFVQQRLTAGESALSLEECIRLWREEQERQDLIGDVIQGMQDDDAGLSQPLSAAFDDVRRQLGFSR